MWDRAGDEEGFEVEGANVGYESVGFFKGTGKCKTRIFTSNEGQHEWNIKIMYTHTT